jgi:hypothetical protein
MGVVKAAVGSESGFVECESADSAPVLRVRKSGVFSFGGPKMMQTMMGRKLREQQNLHHIQMLPPMFFCLLLVIKKVKART